MKAVLISIQPKWCELIANGEKMIEVRKTKPKLETPFKVYIYCTKGNVHDALIIGGNAKLIHCIDYTKAIPVGGYIGNGNVVGEFVCDKIFEIEYQCGSYKCKGLTVLENDRVASASKLSLYDMRSYLSCNNGYGWHISNPVIYDKPKELSEFYVSIKDHWETYDPSNYINGCWQKPLKRPPQSWCYVEEVGEGDEKIRNVL